jgi:hypothetical protein
MKKRLIATLLAISTILSLIPGTVLAAGKDDVTITVVDENGAAITDSALSVKVTHLYGYPFNRTENVTVTKSSAGVYVFDGSKYDQSSTKYYTITATLVKDGRTYSATQQINKYANSVVLTLEDFVQGDKWVSFDVYYIADGHFPDSFHGAADAKYYGPAGDNTPLLSINVNVTELQKRPGVLYQENVGNAYHFVPEAQSESEDSDIAHQENLAYVAKFWEQVKLCMDDASREAFEATGLYRALGLTQGIYNTYVPLILLSMTGLAFKNGLFIFLMRSYYRGVPDELEESSFIDGYGVFQTFFKIILPISGPMLITVFILAFAWQWTDIFYVNTFLPNAESFLLTSSKFWSAMPETLDLLSEAAGTNAKTFEVAVKNTAGLLVVLPLIIMYIFCQRYLVQGIESSGLAN